MVDFKRLLEERHAQKAALERGEPDPFPKAREPGRWPDRYVLGATGQKPDWLFGYDLDNPRWAAVEEILRKDILCMLQRHGKIACISGMDLGVPQLFAKVACELRDEGHDIVVMAALPCKNQDARWRDNRLYMELLDRVDEKFLVNEEYSASCLSERDSWIADRLNTLFSLSDRRMGKASGLAFEAGRSGVFVAEIWDAVESVISEREGSAPPRSF